MRRGAFTRFEFEHDYLRISIKYFLVFGLLLTGLLISAFYSPVWYDDAGHFLVAKEAANGHGICYPLDSNGKCAENSPFITMGPALTWPIAAWMAVFGVGMLKARLFMVLLALGVGWILWRLTKLLGNADKGLVAVGIIGLNIQFLTYGAEVLAEVPMMGMIMLGLLFLLRWQQEEKPIFAGLGLLAFLIAVAIKEYAILPLSLALLLWWLFALIGKRKAKGIFFLGLSFAVAQCLLMVVLHGGYQGFVSYLAARSSYGSEFLAFNWILSLKFLILKPLFWLGTAAIFLKWRIKRRSEELPMLAMQLAWLIFFLLSAGYDRFGFLLLFIPAIYLADFAPYLWKEAGRNPKSGKLKRVVLIMLGLVIFSQQTFPILGRRMVFPSTVNAYEKDIAKQLSSIQCTDPIDIYDQQLVPFLDEGIPWRLIEKVPSAGENCGGQNLDGAEKTHQPLVIAAGPYAFTEYDKCIVWSKYRVIYTGAGKGENQWKILVLQGYSGCSNNLEIQ